MLSQALVVPASVRLQPLQPLQPLVNRDSTDLGSGFDGVVEVSRLALRYDCDFMKLVSFEKTSLVGDGLSS